MNPADETGGPDGAAIAPANPDDEQRALEEALKESPKGAVLVSGIATALLLLGWFAIYFFVFLPRGSVG